MRASRKGVGGIPTNVNSVIKNFWRILAGGPAAQCGLRSWVLQNTQKVETAKNTTKGEKSIIRPVVAMAISTPSILYPTLVQKIRI